MDCSGFNESSIKTDLKGHVLTVNGKEGDPNAKDTGDYSFKEFKKTYDLPAQVDCTKLASFLSPGGTLVIEFPLKDKKRKSVFPKIVDAENGNKNVELDVNIPDYVDPSKLSVTCKDRDLVIRADYKIQKPDELSKVVYRRYVFLANRKYSNLFFILI